MGKSGSAGLEVQPCVSVQLNRQSLCLENLRRAFKHVKSNNGAPGIDGETVKDFATSLENKLATIHDD